MNLGVKELIRQPRRFFPVFVALTLLVVLLVVLGGFLDGLSLSQTGPYRAYDGDVFIFDSDAELQLSRSRVDADAVTADSATGVGDVGTLDSTFTVAAVGSDADSSDVSSDDLSDVVLFGYDLSSDTLPEAPTDGEVVVDKQLQREKGVQVGDTIKIGPSDESMTVTAIVDDLTSGAPTLWVNPDEWRRLVTTINPATLPPDGSHQALVVRPADGSTATDLIADLGSIEPITPATVDDTIDALSVVQQQTSTFQAIIVVTFVVSLMVVALFFALITLEQSRMYAVLKALGARTRELLQTISVQAILITVVALIVGIAISALLVSLLPANLPIRVQPVRLVQISIGLLFTAVIGGLLTARRILKIDPATAIG